MKHHGLRFGAHNLGGLRPKSPTRKPDVERLTSTQRRALTRASHKGGCEIDAVGKPTLRNLLDRELVTVGDVVLITRKGRHLLVKPLPDQKPVYLKQRDGTTTMTSKAVIEAGEIIDPATLKDHWDEEAARRKASTRDGRERARSRKYASDRDKRAA